MQQRERAGRSVEIDRARLVAYAAASGDLNPIHWHEPSARAAGLDGVIAHGMLTMALAASEVLELVDDPGRLRRIEVRFARPVVVPEHGTVTLEVDASVVGARNDGMSDVVVTAQVDGIAVLTKASAVIASAAPLVRKEAGGRGD